MTIDLRARVTCNLGDVISASISDSYIQGSGLVYTTGSCQVKGVISPATGSSVVFEYTKSGITRRIPRTMRVLSSFADPFRRVTDIELGCLLTYLSDLKDPIKLKPTDDPGNEDLTEEDANIVTVPTNASFVMQKCLSELGISATSVPLTNKFSVSDFDLSAGYVSVLSDLLVSECFCGYLDQDETLQIINLSEEGGSGPVIASEDLLDVGPIGVGELPGDAVVVEYSTLKLKLPDNEELEDPDEDPFAGYQIAASRSFSDVVVSYTRGEQQVSQTFSANTYTYDETTYKVRFFENKDDPYGPLEEKSIVTQRKVIETRTAASVIGGLMTQYLSAGVNFGNFSINTENIESFDYDQYGNEIQKTTTKTGDAAILVGMLGLPMVFEREDGSIDVVTIPTYRVTLERTETSSVTIGDFTNSTVKRFVPWVQSPGGQQSVAEGRDSFTNAAQVQAYMNSVFEGLVLVESMTTSEFKISHGQFGPSRAALTNAKNADPSGDPNNGYQTPSSSEIEIAEGSGSAKRRISLSLPYAPDDIFRKEGQGVYAKFYSTASDAPQKANQFGRVQNRMLLGNRSGMNIQIAPEKLPSDPFAAIFIEAAGTIALYRINAASWAVDSSGIVASTDAMFWGTAGSI